MSCFSLKISLWSFLLLFLFAGNSYSATDYKEKHLKVVMRLIGHEVLTASGDSTSVVLPVEMQENEYTIRFESPFYFEPNRLSSIVDSVAAETEFSEHYIVEVKQCESQEIVYSYEMQNAQNELFLPCAKREFERDCYFLCITLLDGGIQEPVQKSTMGNFILGIVAGILALIALLLWIRLRPKKMHESDLIRIGKYQFDNRNMQLLYENEKIDLTGKEGDLLEVLQSSANNTLKRETILNTVWGDDGDYVGRTLDVFISKLRKKLEADSNVKIINVRGVGYKLVIN